MLLCSVLIVISFLEEAFPRQSIHPINSALRVWAQINFKSCMPYMQVVLASVAWKPCTALPTKLSEGNVTIVEDQVFYGGGTTEDDDDSEYTVYCYDPPQDKWTTLPPLPVRYFGLGQVMGKLVAVGGKKKIDDRATDEIYSLDEQSQKWKQVVPPMPTARFAASVLSLKSALIVVGGRKFNTPSSYTDVVEAFHPGTFQWYKIDPIPVACSSMSLVATHGTCYALGGYKYLARLNQALHASVDELLRNAVPANQTPHSGGRDSHTQSVWKAHPKTPNTQPTAAVLAGSVLAVGGKKVPSGANAKEVYMYLPTNNSWIYFSDLPTPQFGTAVAILSSTEILVIGGYGDNDRLSTVYKGTLQFKL